ncbi:hypothetical protein PIB30_109950, partial [Stylosanthes scabra]|nr:hypothetical protein [Stylosanthes scabra]
CLTWGYRDREFSSRGTLFYLKSEKNFCDNNKSHLVTFSSSTNTYLTFYPSTNKPSITFGQPMPNVSPPLTNLTPCHVWACYDKS